MVLVGTGSAREPFGRSIHAAQVATPLLELLLADLEAAQGRRTAPIAASGKPTERSPASASGSKAKEKDLAVRTGAL